MPAATPTPQADARAEDIFSRARAAFVARKYPPEIKYTVRISGLRGDTWTTRSYPSFERWPSATVVARSISDEEAAQPYKPSAFGLDILGFDAPKTDSLDILGPPKLAATYGFGLDPPLGFPSDAPEPRASGAPRLIGSVVSVARNYEVRLAGEETENGHACWHLTLSALGNPGRYRVRDLWVDKSSYATVKLRTDGNFTGKDTGKGYWTVTYAQRADRWYLDDETSEGPVDAAGGHFDKIRVQFVDVQADLHENLDFGISGSNDVPDVVEPEP